MTVKPVRLFGDPVLTTPALEVTTFDKELRQLVADLTVTMQEAPGVGLAAPQIGLPIRLFIVDATPFEDDEDLSQEDRDVLKTFKRVFINAQIIEEMFSSKKRKWLENPQVSCHG